MAWGVWVLFWLEACGMWREIAGTTTLGSSQEQQGVIAASFIISTKEHWPEHSEFIDK